MIQNKIILVTIWSIIFPKLVTICLIQIKNVNFSVSSIVSNVLLINTDSNTIPVALIGAIGVIVAACIAAGASIGVTIYQNRSNRSSTKSSNGLKKVLLHAKTRHVRAYRSLVRGDSRMTSLQILDMSRPLSVTSIYVRLRLHQEARLGYEIDAALLTSETQHDPNAMLAASRRSLEGRISKALDPVEAVRTFKRCVIVGDPGAGKTTLLKYLTLKSASRRLPGLPDLPIHVGLNAFAGSGCEDLLDFASSIWDERYGIRKDKARNYIEKHMETGKALLLLDALDETVIGATIDEAEASYRRVASAISQISTRYHQSLIVVTARKAGYHQRASLPGFTELEILDFQLQDIQKFIFNWFYTSHGSQKLQSAVDLLSRLENNQRIQALAANPLLLSLIVLVYEAQLDLPDRRAELYKQCVETLLTKWDASRDIRRRREFKPEHKRQLLEEIAWHFHIQGRRYFPEAELLQVIANFLPAVGLKEEQNNQILAEIAAENGLLKEQAKGWHGFLHLTLQEYFVALYVVDHNKLDILLAHRGDLWWEEVSLLFAGQAPDASPLLQRLLGLGDDGLIREDIFHTNLILAGRCLAARPTVRQITLRDKIISRLLDILTKTTYSLTGQQITDALVEIGDTEISFSLVSLIPNQQINLRVRQSIVSAVGRLGERSVVPELVQMLSNQQIDREVLNSIASALGNLCEPPITSDLLSLLFNEQINILTRRKFAEALGDLGDHSVTPQLIQLLSNEQLHPYIRGAVAEALGDLGGHSVTPQLIQLLSNEQLHLFTYVSVATALENLRDPSVIPQLQQRLSNKQQKPLQREVIANTLATLGDRSVAHYLMQLLPDSRLEVSGVEIILDALGDVSQILGGTDVLQEITDWQQESSIRVEIAGTLGDLGDHSIVPQLLQLLSDSQLGLELRQSIVNTIGQIADDEAAIHALAGYIQQPEIANEIHKALWTVSHKVGVRVHLVGPVDKQIEIIKW